MYQTLMKVYKVTVKLNVPLACEISRHSIHLDTGRPFRVNMYIDFFR